MAAGGTMLVHLIARLGEIPILRTSSQGIIASPSMGPLEPGGWFLMEFGKGPLIEGDRL